MSKRLQLSNDDMVLITAALKHLHRDSIINPKAYPEYAIASEQRIQQILTRFAGLRIPAALLRQDGHLQAEGTPAQGGENTSE